jgi:small GTP-binding protein
MADLNCQILSDDSPSFDLSFKIIIVGDQGVGKSCLAIKASRNYFEDFYSPTVGFEFVSFNVKVQEKIIKLQIWDTCGQEVYRSLISSFFRSASLAIIVYSIDTEDSFNNIEKWLNDIKTQSNPDIKIFLIGNKADLEDKRRLTKEQGEQLCNDHKLAFFMETSAKTGFNVQNVFIQVAKELYLQHEEIKNRVSRPGTMIMPLPEDNNNNNNLVKLEIEEEENTKRKKFCCFN